MRFRTKFMLFGTIINHLKALFGIVFLADFDFKVRKTGNRFVHQPTRSFPFDHPWVLSKY